MHPDLGAEHRALVRKGDVGVDGVVEIFADAVAQPLFDTPAQGIADVDLLAGNRYLHNQWIPNAGDPSADRQFRIMVAVRRVARGQDHSSGELASQ